MRSRVLAVFLLLFFGFAPVALAATTLYLNANVWSVPLGQTTSVQLSADATEPFSAFHIVLHYPADLVRFQDWSDGDSIVGTWIIEPRAENRTITLEGAVPGGFSGTNGLIASFIFEGIRQGLGTMTLETDSRVFANDSRGTGQTVQAKDFKFRVVDASELRPTPLVSLFKDATPPEPFTVSLRHDPDLFGGMWFTVFGAHDKDSGVDHYEAAETSHSCDAVAPDSWSRASSPYVLHDQSLRSTLCVRAVDLQGNIRVASLAPHTNEPYTQDRFWVTLGIVAAAVFIMCANVIRLALEWRKQKKT